MSLIAARAALTGGGKRLPYDAEVEYLESMGAQWIDTGVSVNSNLRAKSMFMATRRGSNQFLWFFGGRSKDVAGDGFNFGCIDNGKITSDYINRVSSNSTLSLGTFYDIDKNENSCAFNSETLTNQQGQFSYSNTLVIFSIRIANGSVNIQQGGSRCYSFVLFNNGTLVRDFVPVRFTNEQGQSEGAMYDRVSGQLFSNAGTGNFIIGADK